MGRAEERRARQRGGGHRAAPKRSSRAGAKGGATAGAKADTKAGAKSGIRRLFTWKKLLGTFFGLCLLGMAAFIG
ncbi:hypothetical protein ACWD4T_52790, partial [Streptomyces umbrinus]